EHQVSSQNREADSEQERSHAARCPSCPARPARADERLCLFEGCKFLRLLRFHRRHVRIVPPRSPGGASRTTVAPLNGSESAAKRRKSAKPTARGWERCRGCPRW